MRRTSWMLALLAVTMLATLALSGCGQESTTTEPAKDQVEQTTAEKQAAADEAINSAQDKVSELAAAVGDLEARVSGLKINSDLQEIQRKLTRALEEAGDKKVAALDELGNAFDDLIARVDTAAGKLPEGGVLQTELKDFSTKLKDVQTSLADAAAGYEASSTP